MSHKTVYGDDSTTPVLLSLPTENMILPLHYTSEGLTKREYFAAMSLQCLLAHHSIGSIKNSAKEAVRAADALIDALNTEELKDDVVVMKEKLLSAQNLIDSQKLELDAAKNHIQKLESMVSATTDR